MTLAAIPRLYVFYLKVHRLILSVKVSEGGQREMVTFCALVHSPNGAAVSSGRGRSQEPGASPGSPAWIEEPRLLNLDCISRATESCVGSTADDDLVPSWHTGYRAAFTHRATALALAFHNWFPGCALCEVEQRNHPGSPQVPAVARTEAGLGMQCQSPMLSLPGPAPAGHGQGWVQALGVGHGHSHTQRGV